MEPSSINPPPTDNEATMLRELMRRMLRMELMGMVETQVREIVPGGLPATMAFVPPLPAEHTLIGSVVKEVQSSLTPRPSVICEIIFDTPVSPDAIFTFYSIFFERWRTNKKSVFQPDVGGFESPYPTKPYTFTFIQNIAGHINFVVIILVDPLPTGQNEVHIKLMPAQPPGPPSDLATAFVLPHLKMPDQAEMLHNSMSGLQDRASQAASAAAFIVNLNLTTIVAHYDEQLYAAGWERLNGSIDTLVAWSAWYFTTHNQESWSAILTIAQDPEDARMYTLHLNARKREVSPNDLTY